MPNDERSPKSEARRKLLAHALRHSGIRASSFFRHSSFGFRHCPEPIHPSSRRYDGASVGCYDIMNDLHYAFRQLRKNPGFTAVAVLTLALGIGANTAMFSVLNVLLLRALPYPNSERLVRVFRTSPQSQTWPHSVANFFDHREQNSVFERMAAFSGWSFHLAEPGAPAERLRGIIATADFFRTLGVAA